MNRTSRIASAMAMFQIMAVDTSFAADNNVTVQQGGIGRWSAVSAKECGIFGRRYPAIHGVCYYPVDMKTKPGVHEIAVWDAGGARTLGTVTVTRRECAQTAITLDGDKYVKISDEEKKRGAEERSRISDAIAGTDKQPAFALPLGPPAAAVTAPDPGDFCALRVYNGGLVKSRHTGIDYPLPKGTPVVAGANGKVVLAEEHFYTGKTVIVDHGGGLVTMVFHLDEIAAKPGSTVVRGDPVGTVGSTGRSPGPHLHFGARYQNQRIDVGALLGDPAYLPGVAEEDVVPLDGTAGEVPPVAETAPDVAPQEGTGSASDQAAVDAPSGETTENAQGEDGPEPEEDVLEKEAEEQRKADEAAKPQ